MLAREGRPMSVGEIVERAAVGQSTVSHHLKMRSGSRAGSPSSECGESDQ
ncbi:winged helix-turn-helix domain-containing protein [Streptomyces sp. NPDC006326]